MGLRIDTSNDTYHWATSDYWYNNPVHITIYNDDATPAKLGGIRLQLIACNAGGHSVNQISAGQAAGQSGDFALYEYDSWTKISQTVTVAAESRSNLCTADSSEPFSNTLTWFIPRYTKNSGAQYNQNSYDGNYISQQDYNNAFYTFKLSSPLVIPANSYAQVTLRLEGGWGTWQLSDLVNATPLPSYQITYKPNGGNWSGSTSDIVHEVVQGENDSLPSNPTRSGYNFTGWSPSGAPPTNVQQNHTYTAQWAAANATVTFYKNLSQANATLGYGSNPVGTVVGVSGDGNAINPALVCDPSYQGYSRLVDLVVDNIYETVDGQTGEAAGYYCACWRRDSSLKKVPSTQVISDAVNLYGDTVQAGGNNYYAVYKAISGTLKFYRNYDSSDTNTVAGGDQSGVDYITSTLGSRKPTDPTREGYEFQGWAQARTGSVESDNLSLWDTTTGHEITAFYAIWKRLASIWVVEEVTVGGVTQKQWVKKLNVHKVVEDSSHVKSWDDMPPREVVEDSQHNKSWEEKW